MNIVVSIRCPKCQNLFDSQERYSNHLPCSGGHPAGASGYSETEEYFGKADGDDQRRAS